MFTGAGPLIRRLLRAGEASADEAYQTAGDSIGGGRKVGAPNVPSTTGGAGPTGESYSVAYQMTLDPASYPGLSRGAHFQEANESLLTAMEADPEFAQMMQNLGVDVQRTPAGLAPRTSPADWTWHHAEDPGVMQLVPRPQHAPGSIFQDALHPNGRGGYSLWGK